MASRNFAPRACDGALTVASARARRARLRLARLARVGSPFVLALSLLHCAPDFASLSSGGAGETGGTPASSGGRSNGGSSAVLGGSGGTAQGGASANSGGTSGASGLGATGSGGSSSGEAGGGSSGGEAGSGGSSGGSASSGGSPSAGSSSGGGSSGGGAAGGAAGSGGAPCVFSHPKALAFDGFDGGLNGSGFSLATTTASVGNNGTASSVWDSAAGHSCPGALRLTIDFKGYSASSTTATGDLRFKLADWTGATVMHAWVKVSPGDAPLQGVQLFVFSDTTAFRFDSAYDDAGFRSGEWNEMILSLQPGSAYTPSQVFRIGLQVILKTAGSSGNPAVPPVTTVWLDDVWIE
jgi:hypothetical protein